ncbi:MAG: response regulator [Acidimicrobiia bacterium]|nr:response regulator [Acidimicrobiia bacterium]NNC74670.1 response regulator [Acidimicrobiia bacterium]
MKVLVADDSPVLRAAVTKLVEGAGFEVVSAVDGVEAITRFYEEKPDLVLLDVQMPKLTGYVVCRLIKEDPAVAHIPVLILTVRDSEEDRYWGRQSGADGYLTKEMLGDGLVTHIKQTLAARALTELNRGQFLEQPVLGESDVLTRVCEMLDRKLFEATVVNELTAVGTEAMGLRDTVNNVLESLRHLVAFDAGAIVLAGDYRMYLRSEVPLSAEELSGLYDLVARQFGAAISREVDPGDLSVFLLGADPDPTAPADREWSSFYAVPLRLRGETVGMLVLAARRSGAFPEGVYRTMRTLEPAVAAVVDSAVRYQESMMREASSNLSALSGN